MRNFLLISVCILMSFSAEAFRFDIPQYDLEKIVLSQLFTYSNHKVDTKSCNLKKAIVADFISQFILLASDPESTGRVKQMKLECEDRTGNKTVFAVPQNCKLTLGEQIKLPNEPEGWSRTLFFSFDYKKKKVKPKTFACLDIP